VRKNLVPRVELNRNIAFGNCSLTVPAISTSLLLTQLSAENMER